MRRDGAEEIHLMSGSLVETSGKVLPVIGGQIRCEMRWMDCKVDRQHHGGFRRIVKAS